MRSTDLLVHCPRLVPVDHLNVLTVTLTENGIERLKRQPVAFAQGFRRMCDETGMKLTIAEELGIIFILGYVCEASDATELREHATKFQTYARAFLGMESLVVSDDYRALLLRQHAA